MNENLDAQGFKLLIKGPIKDAGATSLLEVRKEKNVEMVIPCLEISVSTERRIQRTIIRGLVHKRCARAYPKDRGSGSARCHL